MKIILVGCLLLVTACQPATPTPAPLPIPTETPPPTPVPVTVTLASTSTPEPSATPLPRFFTNEFDSSLAGWVILQANNDSNPNIKTENSALILQLDLPFTWLYTLYGAQDYSNARIDAQFQNRAGSPSAIGLICRYSEDGGWFEFNVSTDGTYNLLYGRWLAVGIADYLPITDGSSKSILPSGATQQIGLICSNTALSLLINETILRRVNVERYELTYGRVGMTVSSFKNLPVVAAFDWVRVSEP